MGKVRCETPWACEWTFWVIHTQTRSHTHTHSMRLPNAAHKQCPIVQLPFFVPPPNFTRTPRLLLLPVCSQQLHWNTQPYAWKQFATQPPAEGLTTILLMCNHYICIPRPLKYHCYVYCLANWSISMSKQWLTKKYSGPQTWLEGSQPLCYLPHSPMGLFKPQRARGGSLYSC